MKWLPRCYLAVYSVWWHCGVNGGLQSVYWLHPHRGGPQHTSVCVLVREKSSCSLSPSESVESHRVRLSSCCPAGNHHYRLIVLSQSDLIVLSQSDSPLSLSLSLSLSPVANLLCHALAALRRYRAPRRAACIHMIACGTRYVYRSTGTARGTVRTVLPVCV